ncbi:MAG: hypothetical protein HY298_19925 [Verrucomicrobia bacterium]|nr:hypothetical protein [Verrucomicrobiota bacterium]
MKINPKRIAKRLQTVIDGWERLRPSKTFAGMTLDDFKSRVAPSLSTRVDLSTLQTQATNSRTTRHQSDIVSNDLANLVVNAVKGDPEEGEDGPLYAALGYIPKSARRSGLTRKSSTTPPVDTAAGK